ncbi:HU family DNA-binding protein [Bacteroides pyogenes]|uniref:HU family DNA-binding protein n=1 Tax=Bacteroides pyogenes TaxID=310300 RepID=UPI002FDB87CC
MVKEELVQRISKGAGISLIAAGKAVEVFMESVGDELADGGEVILRGFGTFKPVQRAEKLARNIGTGEKVIIPAHKEVKFVVGKELKDKVK